MFFVKPCARLVFFPVFNKDQLFAVHVSFDLIIPIITVALADNSRTVSRCAVASLFLSRFYFHPFGHLILHIFIILFVLFCSSRIASTTLNLDTAVTG